MTDCPRSASPESVLISSYSWRTFPLAVAFWVKSLPFSTWEFLCCFLCPPWFWCEMHFYSSFLLQVRWCFSATTPKVFFYVLSVRKFDVMCLGVYFFVLFPVWCLNASWITSFAKFGEIPTLVSYTVNPVFSCLLWDPDSMCVRSSVGAPQAPGLWPLLSPSLFCSLV